MERRLAHASVSDGTASPSSRLYFLHGIYGAGRNWTTIARRLSRRRAGWGGVLVDLRLHGESRGFEPPHTLEGCARDVRELAAFPDGPGPPRAVLGHSFGGKVALSLLRDPPSKLRQAWIVDVAPSADRPTGSAIEMLRALREIPGPFQRRDDAIRALESRGIDHFVAAWMATNLERDEGGLRWRFDPDEMESLLSDFFRTDLWAVVEAPPPAVQLHFVKAEGSEALAEDACRRIESSGRETGRVHLHRVAGGHWLNADNPEALVDLLTTHLPAAD